MDTTFETLLIERRGRVAVLTMNRPHKKNAMTRTFFRELPQALAALDADHRVGAVVLTGAGDAFSSGADIGTFRELTDDSQYRSQLDLVAGAFGSIERAALPVIAAVNGIAYAGGTEIVLFCDFVIASEHARFSFREIAVGLQPSYGLVRAPDLIGRAWTKRLALTGEIVAATQAFEIGLVQEVVPHERLLETAFALATGIAAGSPVAVRAGKRFVNRTLTATTLDDASQATAGLFETAEHKAAVRAFLERRRDGKR